MLLELGGRHDHLEFALQALIEGLGHFHGGQSLLLHGYRRQAILGPAVPISGQGSQPKTDLAVEHGAGGGS
jgi:hypothetical protein